jgi:hypothetical protein
MEQMLDAVQRIQDLSDRFKVALRMSSNKSTDCIVELPSGWQRLSSKPMVILKWGFDGGEVATSVLPEFQRQDFISMVQKCREGKRPRSSEVVPTPRGTSRPPDSYPNCTS